MIRNTADRCEAELGAEKVESQNDEECYKEPEMSGGNGEGGSGSAHNPKPTTTWETNGERIIFNVPLVPGETTVVSWKKLIKEAKLNNAPDSSGLGQSLGGGGDGNMENTSLGNVPSEDDYDTSDSFIEDNEPNQYFMVDYTKSKHEGFSAHHGELEHTEPSGSMLHHGKKRRHSDMLSDAKLEAAPSTSRDLSQSSPHGLRGSQTSMVEVAMEELQRAVAEFAPPTREVQDPDNFSQACKRKLSPDIKEKLAKVAELTEDSNGKVPKDVIDRLMSIVGHLIQVRALKRNLKVMADRRSLAKAEKEKHVLKTKKEVAEMIESRFPKNGTEFEQHKLGKSLEDKICNLYDLFLERQDDANRSLIRVYNELASLWPAGLMNFDRIRRAVDRAKRRKQSLTLLKDQDEAKKKSLPALKVGKPIKVAGIPKKPRSDSRRHPKKKRE